MLLMMHPSTVPNMAMPMHTTAMMTPRMMRGSATHQLAAIPTARRAKTAAMTSQTFQKPVPECVFITANA